MNKRVIKWTGNVPGYGAAMPNGDYACLIPGSHIETSRGRVELPMLPTLGPLEDMLPADDQLLKASREDVGFIDIDIFDGELVIVGAGQSTDRALLWQNGAWRAIAHPAYGMDACMFNPALGEAWVTTDGKTATCTTLMQPVSVRKVPCDTGSQGFAFAKPNGEMALGWKYYADVPRGLCVYTEWPDVAIGQGIDTGAVVRFADDGVLRQFATGQARFPRIKRSGEQYACVFLNLPGHETTIAWLTRAELRAMKPVGAVPPPPPPPEPPVPDPLLAPNEFATVVRVMREHPEIKTGKAHEATRGVILDYICAALGGKPWGRKAKDKAGTKIENTDVIAFLRPDNRFEMYDVIAGNTEGSAMWDGPKLGPTVQGTNGWWAPARPVPVPDEPPDEPPVPPDDWRASVEARLRALEGRRLVTIEPA